MDFIGSLAQSGVVGAGGAGFPTYKKLDCKAEYLLLNGAECEPLLETDKFLMRTKAREIVRGAQRAGDWIGARSIRIVLKRKYVEEARRLQQAIEEERAPVQLCLTDSFYPAGDEQVMVYEVLQRTVPPTGIPIQVGAVVSNVCTMLWVSDALEGQPVTTRHVSVLGEVGNPCVMQAPIGTPLKACIKAAGGSRIAAYCAIVGGPMMGRYLTHREVDEAVVTKTTGGIILVKEDSVPVKKARLSVKQILNRARSVCVQCSFCTEQCPRNLIGHPLRPHHMMRRMAYGSPLEDMREALLCSECGVCENYSCPMGLSPRQVNIHIKFLLREKGIRYEPGSNSPRVPQMREYRKAPVDRLTRRLGYMAYVFHSGDVPVVVTPEIVRIPLKQHIGMPAKAVVGPGDKVAIGQVIGEMEKGALGVNIHASINGTVTVVNDSVQIVSDKAVSNHA